MYQATVTVVTLSDATSYYDLQRHLIPSFYPGTRNQPVYKDDGWTAAPSAYYCTHDMKLSAVLLLALIAVTLTVGTYSPARPRTVAHVLFAFRPLPISSPRERRLVAPPLRLAAVHRVWVSCVCGDLCTI